MPQTGFSGDGADGLEDQFFGDDALSFARGASSSEEVTDVALLSFGFDPNGVFGLAFGANTDASVLTLFFGRGAAVVDVDVVVDDPVVVVGGVVTFLTSSCLTNGLFGGGTCLILVSKLVVRN